MNTTSHALLEQWHNNPLKQWMVEWGKLSIEECQKWIESMPRKIQAVAKAKGGHIKY